MTRENEFPVDYERHIKSDIWKKRAQEAKDRFGKRCQVCNRHQDTVDLDAHHRTYDRLGHEDPEDITVLCRDCHALYSHYDRLIKAGNIELIKKYGKRELNRLISDKLDRVELSASGKNQNRIAYGIHKLDTTTGGLSRTDFILAAGIDGVGKTDFASYLAVSAALSQGKKLAFFTTHRSAEFLINMLLAQCSGASPTALRAGKVTKEEWEKVIEGANLLSGAPITIDDTPRLSVRVLRDKCQSLYSKGGLDLIIIDRLNNLHNGPWKSIQPLEIKYLARELGVPIVATYQTAETRHKTDRRPCYNDLPDDLYNTVDIFIGLHIEARLDDSDGIHRQFELVLDKNLYGPVGRVVLPFSGSKILFDHSE